MSDYKGWYADVYGIDTGVDFYSTAAWRKTRRECLYRDNYRCVRCEKRLRSENLSAHHIIPRAQGGSDDISNLMTLCNECHDFVEIAELRTYSAIVGSFKENEDKPSGRPENMDETQREDEYKRPEWHKWVYGGCKRRRR